MLQTKDLVDATGIDRETLRFYENKGLLIKPKRSKGGYRQYENETVNRIEFIMKAKTSGFTLREIKELLNIKDSGKATCKVGKEIAERKMAEIGVKIKALKEMNKMLKRFASLCDDVGLNKPCCLSFYCTNPEDKT